MVDVNSLANNAEIGLSLDGGVPEDEIKGLTAIRVIIRLSVRSGLVATSGNFSGGIYIVENDALSAGAFADPADSVDDAGWLWRLSRQTYANDSINDYSQFLQIREDLRAMRKYPGEDYTLIMVIQNRDADAIMNVDGIVRTLFKRA